MPVLLKKELGELHRSDPTNALIQAFIATDKRLVAELGQDAADFSGCTGTVALQQGNTLYVACVGDSRAVIAFKEGGRFECNEMSRDHRPSLPDERNRILERGGRVEPKKLQSGDFIGPTRVWLKDQNLPGLLVTRSLGDAVRVCVCVCVCVRAVPAQLSFAAVVSCRRHARVCACVRWGCWRCFARS